MLKYKINVLEELKNKGYSSYKLTGGKGHKNNPIFGEKTIQSLRTGEMVGLKTLNMLCIILECQPGDIIEYVKEESEQAK